MSNESPLSVDVSELLRHPGSTKRLQFELHLEGVRLPMAWVDEEEPLRFDLRLDALVDGLHVSGTVSAAVGVECSRCLTRSDRRLEGRLDEVFLPDEGAEDDTYRIEGDRVDLEPAIRDALVLALPLNPLCREECRGLCPVCGVDRNADPDCGHDTEKNDIRWGALEKLRDRLEG